MFYLGRDPPTYGSSRHRFAGRHCKEVKDGRRGWRGLEPSGARVSRELAVTAAELSGWRDQFLAGGEASLKSRPADARDAEIDRLQAKVGELTMATELLEAKIERLEGHRPLARQRPRSTPRGGPRGDPGGDEPASLSHHRPCLWP